MQISCIFYSFEFIFVSFTLNCSTIDCSEAQNERKVTVLWLSMSFLNFFPLQQSTRERKKSNLFTEHGVLVV